MRVLATGPESSGTRALTQLLAAGGADAVHRSQPEGPDWIDMAAMADEFDVTVVVIRGRLAHIRSQISRVGLPDTDTEAQARRRKALGRIAPILGRDDVLVATYESLEHEAERRHLLTELGLDPDAATRPWIAQNAKHYERRRDGQPRPQA